MKYNPKIAYFNFNKLLKVNDPLFYQLFMEYFYSQIKTNPEKLINIDHSVLENDLDFLSQKLICFANFIKKAELKFKQETETPSNVEVFYLLFMIKKQDIYDFENRGFDVKKFLILEEYLEKFNSKRIFNATFNNLNNLNVDDLYNENDAQHIKNTAKVLWHVKKIQHIIALYILFSPNGIDDLLINFEHNIPCDHNNFLSDLHTAFWQFIPAIDVSTMQINNIKNNTTVEVSLTFMSFYFNYYKN